MLHIEIVREVGYYAVAAYDIMPSVEKKTIYKDNCAMSENYLTIEDVARKMSVSRQTIERMIKAGTLPATRFGGRLRISPVDLQNYLDGQRTGHSRREATDEL